MEIDLHKLIMETLHEEAKKRGHGCFNARKADGKPDLYQEHSPPHVSSPKSPQWTLSGEHTITNPKVAHAIAAALTWATAPNASPDIRDHFTNYTIQATDNGISISLNYDTHTVIPYDDPDLLEKVWLFVEIEGPKNYKKREHELTKFRI